MRLVSEWPRISLEGMRSRSTSSVMPVQKVWFQAGWTACGSDA